MKTSASHFHRCPGAIISILAAGSLVIGFRAQAVIQTLPFVDHIPYTNNANLGSTGNGNTIWARGASASTAMVISDTAALNYPGLASSDKGVILTSTGSTKGRGVEYTSQSSGTVYCSVLLNIQTPPSGNRLTAYLQTGTSGGTTPSLGIFVTASGQVGIGKAAGNPAAATLTASPVLAQNTTHLIVARYTFNGGPDDDQVDFWVDPAPLGDNGNIPAPIGIVTNGSDAATLDTFFFNSTSANGGTLWLDESRVGTTWADVTTTGSGNSPTGVPLFITNNGDGTFALSLTGVPNGTYYLESAPALASPTVWTPAAGSTNAASPGGQWSYPVGNSASRQFFRAAQAVP